MPGLRKLCKLYGGIDIIAGGKKERYVFDYKNDCPVPEREMEPGSDRWTESEKVRRVKKGEETV